MKEIISLRKAKEKHFLCEDGTFKAFCYKDDIHYLDNGEYKEIDNTLIKQDNKYVNKSNNLKISFSNCIDSNSLYKVELENKYIDFKIRNNISNNCKIEVSNNVIEYKNILDNVDFIYELIGTKCKETIILYDNKNSDLRFILKTNLNLKLENNHINAYDNERLVYKFDVPYIYNYDGIIDDALNYELIKHNDCYEIILKVKEFVLNNSQFPLFIDPTLATADDEIYDTYIDSKNTKINYNNNDYLKIGVDAENTIYRTLLKFKLPVIGTGSQIISATGFLISHPRDYRILTEDFTHEKITIHEINENWDETTASWESLNDKYNSKIETYTELLRTEETVENDKLTLIVRANDFDLTNIVKKWYSGTPNYGIMLKFLNESYNSDCKEYYMYSKNNTANAQIGFNPKPYLEINYRNQNGYSDYQEYASYILKGGLVDINLYNGNLLGMFDIKSTFSNTPANLGITYNTNDKVLNNYYNGWKFTLKQKIRLFSLNNSEYIEWLDSSSKLIYFKKDGDKYYDEDGQNLYIELIDSNYIINSSDGSKNYFKLINGEYLLFEIVDSENKKIRLFYDNENRLINIKDSMDEEINITYNENTIIVSNSIDTTTIELENNNVKKIIKTDNTTVISYNDNNLIYNITDLNSTGVTFEYYSNSPYRIKKYYEVGNDGTAGKTFEFDYSFNVTKITENNDIKYTYTFNNQGNLAGTTIMSNDKLLANSYGINKTYHELNGDKKNNKMNSSTTYQKYIANYLYNSSFEKNSNSIFDGGERTDEFHHIGKYCYKGNNIIGLISKELLPNINGKVTFSGYIKNTDKVILEVYETTSIRDILVDTIYIEPNDDFSHFELTTDFNSRVDEYLKIKMTANSNFYIDDVQLELGEVANYYNLIDNANEYLENIEISGSFENGADYPNCYEIDYLPDNNKEIALTLKSKPNASVIASLDFPFEGQAGDIYRLSFWYKNEGVLDTPYEFVGNQANIQFWSSNEEMGTCTYNIKLNKHSEEWQYFSESYVAESDYTSFNVNIMSLFEANNLAITNISIIKDLSQYKFEYDAEGNMISLKDLNGNTVNKSYDKNNQITASISPEGESYTYEYDNNNNSRILKSITQNGITNEYIYDEFGNIIKSISKRKNINKIENGEKCCIRLMGTDDYLHYSREDNTFVFTKNICNNHEFIFLEDSQHFRIKFNDLYFYISEANVLLTDNENNATLFNLTKLPNNSYVIKLVLDDSKVLGVKENKLKLIEFNIDDSNQYFYIENTNDNSFIETTAKYSNNGKFMTTISDSLGKETNYKIDEANGLVKNIIDANNKNTSIFYNDKNLISSIDENGRKIEYDYYDNGLLKEISNYNNNIHFDYDNFSNMKTVKINDSTLLTNFYSENNGKLISKKFGNNQTILYDYNEFNQLKSLTEFNGTYNLYYNNSGNLAKITSENEQYLYLYDLSNKLYKFISKNDNNNFIINYEYNKNNDVIKTRYSLQKSDLNLNFNVHYVYDEYGILSYINYGSDKLNYVYDDLGRIVQKNINDKFKIEYNYLSKGKRTSLLVSDFVVENDHYKYTYDANYNLINIYLNNQIINHFEYNEFKELIVEKNYILNEKTKFVYDKCGNILKKLKYTLDSDILIKSDTYKYNPNWLDQLEEFNNEKIIYDEIGNPTKIGTSILTWINGKQLKSIINSNQNLNISYLYNKNGLRIKKIVNNEKTEYFYDENNLVFEKKNNNVIYYLRDAVDELIGFKYNNESFYYVKNNANDIIGIKDASFKTIATYAYDVLGNIISIKDSNGNDIVDKNNIALINPFRYRSYYFDDETQWYYLENRYYNPKWGRFLNADDVIGTSQTWNAYNLYCYVNNNFVNASDKSGHFFIEIATTEALVGYGIILVAGLVALANQALTSSIDIPISIPDIPKNYSDSPKKEPKKNKRDKDSKTCTVYGLYDEHGDIKYVGRTYDLPTRKAVHEKNTGLELHEIKGGLDYYECRGLEQYFIYNKGTLHNYKIEGDEYKYSNKINGIGINNKNRYDYFNRAMHKLHGETFVGEEIYEGDIDWGKY